MALRVGPYGPVPAAPVLALGAVGAVLPRLTIDRQTLRDWAHRFNETRPLERFTRPDFDSLLA
jgi:hypothetical protein